MVKAVCSLFNIGYWPGSGTWASVLVCVCVWFVGYISYAFVVFFTLIAFFCVQNVLKKEKAQDPSWIVIDEVVGVFFTFVGMTLSCAKIVVGFLLFRFFDIVKPGVIGRCEKLPGEYGVLADDIVAGLFAMIGLRLGEGYVW